MGHCLHVLMALSALLPYPNDEAGVCHPHAQGLSHVYGQRLYVNPSSLGN